MWPHACGLIRGHCLHITVMDELLSVHINSSNPGSLSRGRGLSGEGGVLFGSRTVCDHKASGPWAGVLQLEGGGGPKGEVALAEQGSCYWPHPPPPPPLSGRSRSPASDFFRWPASCSCTWLVGLVTFQNKTQTHSLLPEPVLPVNGTWGPACMEM